MRDAILNPWPWYVAGPLIGLTIPIMLLLGGKNLGVSNSFRHLCAILLPKTKVEYFRSDPLPKEFWNVLFVAGMVLGGWLASRFFSMNALPLLPPSYHSPLGAAKLIGGGILIGFGTRYAAGCTSGHSIMGLSNLQKASLFATLSFFAGGLAAAGLSLLFGG